MGVRDALLLNLTGSNFEALQTDDTARIKGDLSLQKDSGVEVLGIDSSQGSINVSGDITGSLNISSSLSSTGSFGRVVATTFHGDGSALKDTLPRSVGIVTQSAQLAAQISGAFTEGFEFSSSISGGITITGSFGRVEAGVKFTGDGTGLRSTLTRPTGILTSSAQIASQISGSFNKGFEYTGIIKGATVTAGGTWSAGGALASSISYHGVAGDKTGQIAAMGVSGNNALSTLDATRTFEYNGTSWSEASDNNTNRARAAGAGTVNSGLFFGGFAPGWYGTSQGATECYNGTNFSEVNDMIMPRRTHMGAGLSGDAALALGGYTDSAPLNPGFSPNMGKFTEVWNGTNWSESGDAPKNMKRGGMAGSVNSAVVFGSNTDADLTLHWDGSTWSEGGSGHSPVGIDNVHGGTQNDAISAASGYIAPYTYTKRTQYYDGTTWSDGSNMINAYAHRGMGGNQGNAAGALATGGEGGPVAGFGGQTATEEHTGGTAIISGSFGRLDAITLAGDGSGIAKVLPYGAGLITSSAQLADQISGSFNKGFEFSGEISGSATSTGSFGRIVADVFHGDASNLVSTLPRSTGHVTGSAQLADNISGSFNKGFEFTGTIQTSPGGVWSAGGALNASTNFAAGLGTKSAALAVGTTNTSAKTEEYNGSSWSEVNDLNTGRGALVGTGTTEASIVYGGGSQVTCTEEFNGSNWSEVNDMIMGRFALQKLGITSEAALAVGGNTTESGYQDNDVEDWNGTNWSAGTAVLSAAGYGSSAGTYDSGIVFKWPGSETFCWNGSSWSEEADRTGARHCSAGAGSSNDALITGGNSPTAGFGNNTACTELYNGTSWSTGPNLANGRSMLSSADGGNTGTSNTMVFGGASTSTEHYNANISTGSFGRIEADQITGDGSWLAAYTNPVILSGSKQIATYISGSFNKGFGFGGEISGSAISTGSFGRVESDDYRGDGSGLTNLNKPSGMLSQSAQIASNISGSFNKGFEFTGTIQTSPGGVWNTATALIGSRNAVALVGHKGSAIAAGGSPNNVNSETWNGSSWSETNNLPTGGGNRAGFGVDEDAAVVAGGYPNGDQSYEWNGTNWTEIADLPSSQDHLIGAGSSTEAGIVFRGYPGDALEWNGSNWSEITNAPSNGIRVAGLGESSEAAMQTGGDLTPTCMATQVEVYNGTNWSEVASLSIGRRYHSAGGTTNDAFVAGGNGWTPSGGFPAPGSGTVAIANTEVYDGTSWSSTSDIPAAVNFWEGNVGACGKGHGMMVGNPSHYQFTNNIISASFGRVDAISFQGDGSNIASLLPHVSGLVTSSAQLAISGAFTSGFEIKTPLVGSASFSTSHDLIASGSLTGSNARASRMGVDVAFFTGVSGSNNMNFGGGALSSSQAGSDYTHLLEDDKVGQVRSKLTDGVWSVSAALIAGRHFLGGVGIQNAALAIGGSDGSVNATTTVTEEFNGTTWTELNDNTRGNNNSGATGTTYAAVSFGGNAAPQGGASKWNGVNWSATEDLSNPAYSKTIAAGTQNAAIVFGHTCNPTSEQNATEHFDGTNYTAGGALITDHDNYGHGDGLQNAALIVNGTGASQEYNGSTWSATATRSDTNKQDPVIRGTQNNAMAMLGTPGTSNVTTSTAAMCTEYYDGTSWSEGSSAIYGGRRHGGAGASQFGGLTFGGIHSNPTDPITCAQILDTQFNASGSFGFLEGDFHGTVHNNFTSSLISGMLTGSRQIASYVSGSYTSGIDLKCGGHLKSGLGAGVWSFGPDMNAYGRYDNRLAGSQNAMAMIQGDVSSNPPGYTGGNPAQSTHEHYDGTAWKWMEPMIRCGTGNSSPAAGTWGSQNSFGAAGRNQGSTAGCTELWNGTSWSEVNNLITARGKSATSGCTVDDALFSGGIGADNSAQHCCTELWNGTNWSDSQRTIRNLSSNHVAGGTSNSFFLTPGNANNTPQFSEIWNGSSWSTVAGVPDTGGKAGQGGDGNVDNFVYYGAGSGYWGSSAGAFWNGLTWSNGPNKLKTTAEAGGRGFGGGMGGPAGMIAGGRSPAASVGFNQTELFGDDNMTTTASFGIVKSVKSNITTDAFAITGSTFKLPLFSDRDLHYQEYEAQESTGSISGSENRYSDVDILNKPGHFFFHSDYNALGFTYVSASIYSQSADLVTCQYTSASYIQSQSTGCGYVTSSFYKYTNVVCYITGSYT